MVIETPGGSRNKYEADHRTGRIHLDRMLFTATRFPADYGYLPGTLAPDGDPLDVLVLLDEPTFPGCEIRARVVGLFRMRDERGEDAKVLGVPASDPRWASVEDLPDLSGHLLEEIGHFFAVYKDLEPGKGTEIFGWADARAAARAIDDARRAGTGSGAGAPSGPGHP